MKVLIAIENEQSAEFQIDFLVNHKWPDRMSFNILHVIEPVSLGFDGNGNERLIKELDSRRQEQGKALIDKFARQLRTAIPDAAIIENISAGYATEIILDTAEEWHADAVVVSSHGRTGLARAVIGSVSQAVLTYAQCSVIVVRPPREAKVMAQ